MRRFIELVGPAGRAAAGFAMVLFVLSGSPSAAGAQAAARNAEGEGVAPVAGLLERVHESFPGRVLQIELEDRGSPVYEVKLLTDSGNVLKLSYDARNLRLQAIAGRRGRDDGDAVAVSEEDDERESERSGSNSGSGSGGESESDDDSHSDRESESDDDSHSDRDSESDNSGSGSDNSGSGSDSSGSGSSGSEKDD